MRKREDKMPKVMDGGGDRVRKHLVKSAIEIKSSLDKAMDKAGGAPLTADQLDNITALELLSLLATNKVKFVYEE